MAASTRVIHSIVCCRILLNLKQAAKPKDTSAKVTSDLVFGAPPDQQTSELETVLSGVRSTQIDEESHGSGVAGDDDNSVEVE